MAVGWRILLAEDDSRVAEGISGYFGERGIEVITCATKDEAHALIDAQTYDLAILDVMLGEGPQHINDGFYLCKRIQRQNAGLPVILFTGARTDDMSIDQGYDLGCHDYVTKPCPESLLYRKARAMIQLAKAKETSGTELSINGIAISTDARRCFVDGTEVHLTQKQFDLLHYLMVKAGTALSYKSLLSQVWNYHSFNDDPRVVANHISRMKKELGDKGRLIECVPGVGYRFQGEA